MNTKLTISLEKQVIEKAKAYAKDNGRSLSKIIENYLRILTEQELQEYKELDEATSYVNDLRGSLKAPADKDYKTLLAEARDERFNK